jgi:hypothetical protein
MKIKNRILAIEAAPAAMPKKPRAPAMIAIMRKINVQRNIGFNLSYQYNTAKKNRASPIIRSSPLRYP